MIESSEPPADEDFPRSQRWLAAIANLVLLGLFVYFPFRVVPRALGNPDLPLWGRLPLFALSGLCLCLFLWLAYSLLRRKWKTGRFLLTRADAATKRAETLSRIGAGKPFWPQARYFALPAILSAVILCFAFGLFGLGLSECQCDDHLARNSLFGLAALVFALSLVWPIKMILRKRKTGFFLPSEAEIAKALEACAKPKLRQKILLPTIYWANAILFTVSALRHSGQQPTGFFSPWFLAAIWWFAAAIWTWRYFGPSTAQCAISIAPTAPRDKPSKSS